MINIILLFEANVSLESQESFVIKEQMMQRRDDGQAMSLLFLLLNKK